MSIQWAYGVCTVPSRRNTLLPPTLASLVKGGFDKPRLFIDGRDDYSSIDLPKTYHIPAIGLTANRFLALGELVARFPKATRFALFEDDLLCCCNLLQYLSRKEYPEKSYLNLFVHPNNSKKLVQVGWNLSNQKGQGAVALVFDRQAAAALLTSSHPTQRLWNLPPDKLNSVDGAICDSLVRLGFKEYVHNPSLVQHVGRVSSIGDCFCQAASFPGESFDAMTLP